MLLPTIIKTTEESILNIPEGYKLSSHALGASETQTTFKVILPNAIPGILTSILLSVGRIIGESAALIFAIGTAIQDDVSLFKGSSTLAVHIWTVMSGENPNYGMACVISLIILIVVLILNILVKLVCKKLNKFEVK
jgi:phosphate transport system permease protein